MRLSGRRGVTDVLADFVAMSDEMGYFEEDYAVIPTQSLNDCLSLRRIKPFHFKFPPIFFESTDLIPNGGDCKFLCVFAQWLTCCVFMRRYSRVR